MKNRTHFYVSRKNVLTWLMALCMVASAVARIGNPGLKGSGDTLHVWCQIILPIAAALLYAAIALVSGEEFFFKTAIPVWLAAIYSGIWISRNVEGKTIGQMLLQLPQDETTVLRAKQWHFLPGSGAVEPDWINERQR